MLINKINKTRSPGWSKTWWIDVVTKDLLMIDQIAERDFTDNTSDRKSDWKYQSGDNAGFE